MKLKKIASLMLAGIMAVSMLTACGGKTVDDTTEQPKPEEPAATGYSATVQSKLSTIAGVKLTLADDSNLDKALDYAVGFASANKIGDWYVTEDMMGFISGKSTTSAGEVTKSVIEAMDANKNGLDATKIGDVKDFLTPDKDNYDKDNQDIVFTYIINGQTSMNNVLELVAEDISKNVMDNMSLIYNIGNGNNSEVPYYFTGSVSAKTVDLDDSHGVSATFVAVELVRHIGK